MQFFAPNVLVVGDTIFESDDPTGKPNPPAAAALYESEVMALQQKIQSLRFGAQWLDIVGNNAQPIVIVPATFTNDAVAQTFPNIAQRPNRSADATNGIGTPVRVKFNTKANLGWLSGGVSGEVLLVHEMTHAYRSANGQFSPLPMAGFVNPDSASRNSELAKRFLNWEEWLAVVVENVFAAEAGKKILRTNWDILLPSNATDPSYFKFWGISTVGSLNDSQQFAVDYKPAISRMLHFEPRLFRAMESSTAWFNPVRDYVADLMSTRL